MAGPTLSEAYNFQFGEWLEEHPDIKPECEHCGRDMTASPVVEGRCGWYCSVECQRLEEGGTESPLSSRDEQRHEARQMGFTALD